jgi:hypothetical protein
MGENGNISWIVLALCSSSRFPSSGDVLLGLFQERLGLKASVWTHGNILRIEEDRINFIVKVSRNVNALLRVLVSG